MRLVTLLCCCVLAACVNGNVCEDDHCVCAANEPCQHTCSPGGNDCHIQCAADQTCDVTCDSAEDCHVEASSSSHSTVDCAGSPDCHVTCPLGGCTVDNCVGSNCIVACFTGAASIHGTTASCP